MDPFCVNETVGYNCRWLPVGKTRLGESKQGRDMDEKVERGGRLSENSGSC